MQICRYNFTSIPHQKIANFYTATVNTIKIFLTANKCCGSKILFLYCLLDIEIHKSFQFLAIQTQTVLNVSKYPIYS